MSRKLAAYFSATGTTANVAKTLAEAAGADLYEINAGSVLHRGRFKLER